LKFYLPNFEDLVDPEYDFLTDRPSTNRNDRWLHDRMAHDFFDNPIFDGMLVSKASISPIAEKYIRKAGGIHPFTRLNAASPIMGDCGAFTYLLSEKPVYSVQQTLDYYQEFGFDYGVSLDHLSFVTIEMLEGALKQGKVKEQWWQNKTNEQLQSERFELTLQNAQEFLDLHTRQKPTFKPIGIAQGSTPEHFYIAVERLIKMGYEYIALGGLVKHKDHQLIPILERLQPLIKNGIKIHIFGVARLKLIPEFIRLGVTSADSSAPLRKAFLGNRNYWVADGKPPYQAIRVPEVTSKRTKRGVHTINKVLQFNAHLSPETLAEMEQKALASLRAYDKGQMELPDVLETVLAYDRLFRDKDDYSKEYERTLSDKPWQACDCPICKKIGIEVLIFRGNNRNRRRGFHNVKVFYEQMQYIQEHPELLSQMEAVEDEEPEEIEDETIPKQLMLDEVWT